MLHSEAYSDNGADYGNNIQQGIKNCIRDTHRDGQST